MTPRIPLFNMFGPSPLIPLETHIDKAHACAKTLLPFFEAVMAEDWDKSEKLYLDISKKEEEADELKRDFRLHLHKDLFLPVPRSDLLMMIVLQDQIANKAKDIAGLVVGRKMKFPAHSRASQRIT